MARCESKYRALVLAQGVDELAWNKASQTSIFSEKISPANDGLFVLDGLFVHEGLYVYVQLTYKFQLVAKNVAVEIHRRSSLQDVGSYNIQVSSNSRS